MSWIETEYEKIVSDFEAVDWVAIAAWFDHAIAGLQTAITVAETVDPALAPACVLISAAVAAAKIAADDLLTLASAKEAGTAATVTQLTTAATAVDQAYKTAAAAVGIIVAGKSTSKAVVQAT